MLRGPPRADKTGHRRGGGGGQGAEQGKGGGAPSQPDVQAVPCIPPGIQQMPAHHAYHHQQLIYNIDPGMGDLIPPETSQPPYQPAPHPHSQAPHGSAPAAQEPWAVPARMAAAPAAQGLTRHRHSRRRSRVRSRHGGHSGPGAIGPGTGTRFPTLCGARPSPCYWSCMGG